MLDQDVDAIIVNSAFLQLFNEVEGYENLASQLREIHKIQVVTEKEEKPEPIVSIDPHETLPDISGNVFFYDIQSGNKCVTGKIKYNDTVYGGKITSNVTPKNIRDWMKKKRISVHVISKTDKEYIVKPVN